MKILLEGAELFHADRGTERTKQIVPFRNFANVPKKLFTGSPWKKVMETQFSFTI